VQASEYFNEAAYSAAKSLADGIGSSISVISTAIDQFAKLLDFKAPSKDAMTTFVNALKSIVSAMTNLVLPASEDIGVQLIQGIIKGIQSQVAALSKALDDAMGQALDSIKVTLGIASPSKVFEEQVGTNIAAGIASGMNKITEPNFGGLLAATDNFRSASVAMAANTPLTSNNASYTEQYNVYASYKHQEESTIRDDLRMVHMLRGR
jgi:tRNA A37 threonylcarbamoyltransferase TsaD